jgi:hypothetical protein
MGYSDEDRKRDIEIVDKFTMIGGVFVGCYIIFYFVPMVFAKIVSGF